MAHRLYRCYNCPDAREIPGRDFLADKPVCPACGLDGAPGSRFENKIVQLRTVHLDPPHASVKGSGIGSPACGGKREGAMMSGDPNAVNCPKCKESAAFKARKAAWDSSPDDIDVSDLEAAALEAARTLKIEKDPLTPTE